MGNIIGHNSEREFDKIYNKIKTDALSDNISYEQTLNNQINALSKFVALPDIQVVEDSEIDMSKLNLDELSEKSEKSMLSATSPFISSEMYKYFKSQKGGNMGEEGDTDDSSSSDENGNDVEESAMSQMLSDMEEHGEPEEEMERMPSMTPTSAASMENEGNSDSMMSGISVASYISSSDNYNSENLFTTSNEKTNNQNSDLSVANRKILSDSVNTSDINMISVEN